jgi:hypothetical protein
MKTYTISDRDLDFVRKYCLGGTFPASDEHCLYAKVKLLGTYVNRNQPGGIFLGRYPGAKTPTHKAQLISDLNECPNTARRKGVENQIWKRSHCEGIK